MRVLRSLVGKLRFSRRSILGLLGAIVTSLLLVIGVPLLKQDNAQAQQSLQPFSGQPAPKPAYFDRLVSLVDQDRERLVTIFKDIHQNPELGFMETRTSGIVAENLRKLGYEVKTSIALKGNAPPLVNDAELVERLNPQLVNLVGQQALLESIPATTGSEDVALLKGDNEQIKLDFVFVGIADPALFAQARAAGQPVPFANHNGNFQVDLNAIPLGAKAASVITMGLLENAQ